MKGMHANHPHQHPINLYQSSCGCPVEIGNRLMKLQLTGLLYHET